jgi:putative cardiolipin synthase
MLKAGVSLYETDSDQLKKDPFIGRALGHSIGRSHSKLIVLDRQLVFVGSMNLDLRSSRVNTELGMLVQSHELADMVVRLTDRVREGSYRLRLTEPGDHIQWVATAHGVETTFDNEPGVALTTRLKLLLLSPLVSESLL